MPTSRIVITGGPGAGKSTLIAALAAAGHRVFPEAGRALLRLHDAIGGPAHAARSPRDYAEAMLNWDLRSWAEAETESGATFFDRGIPDTIGYLRLIGRPVPAHMTRACLAFRYADPVFVAPPWREIFGKDAERQQSWHVAIATHAAICGVYEEHGYRLVELPRAGVEERLAFLLARS